MPTEMLRCPNDGTEMMEINFDKVNLGIKVVGCTTCNEVYQVLSDGSSLIPLKSLMDAISQRGGERVERAMSAFSRPTPTTLKSFLELYNMTTNRAALDLGALGSALMEHLAQIEGLLDSAVSGLAELAMVPGPAREIYGQIQQARELVSVKPPKQRGTRE